MKEQQKLEITLDHHSALILRATIVGHSIRRIRQKRPVKTNRNGRVPANAARAVIEMETVTFLLIIVDHCSPIRLIPRLLRVFSVVVFFFSGQQGIFKPRRAAGRCLDSRQTSKNSPQISRPSSRSPFPTHKRSLTAHCLTPYHSTTLRNLLPVPPVQ